MSNMNKIVHQPNVFPERPNGPLGVDIQGEQFINGGTDRVYFYKFWGLRQGLPLSAEKCAYFHYKKNGELDETKSIEVTINNALVLLGAKQLKPDSIKKKAIVLPDMDKVGYGRKMTRKKTKKAKKT